MLAVPLIVSSDLHERGRQLTVLFETILVTKVRPRDTESTISLYHTVYPQLTSCNLGIPIWKLPFLHIQYT